MVIRVALVEDQRLVREILEAQLAREADIEVVGATGEGRDAIAMARRARPDVLIVDLGLPDIDGLEVARAVHAQDPAIRLIVLSVDTRPERVRRLMEAGARGYVVKSGALRDLLRAVHVVADGETYLSPELARPPAAAALALGPREREVLALIAAGLRTAQIGARLGISPATVESHRRNIMRKLNLHSVAGLTKFALREGLASL